MSAPTFLETLTYEAGRLQAARPEKAEAIGEAKQAIVDGHVVDKGSGNGQVLSRDGATWYGVGNQCTCPAGQFGQQDCRHLRAWRLYEFVRRRLAAQTPQEPQEPAPPSPAVVSAPEPAPVQGDNCHLETPSQPEVIGASPNNQPLPEAPASVNCQMTIGGRQVQLTLRDTDEARLLARLQTVLAQYPLPQPVPTQGQGKDWCVVHQCAMKETTKDGHSWFSYRRADGQWCKGR
jgi:hypothetical protein